MNVLPAGTLFEPQNIGLFGTTGHVSATSPNDQALLPYSLYGTMKQIGHFEYSNYNSMQSSWNKQSGHGNWLMNYTFSKALGIRGENGTSGVGDPINIKNDYGVLPNDRTHIFNAAYVYQEGSLYKGNKFLGGVVNGWQLSGITQFQSGSPLQAVNSSNFGNGRHLPPRRDTAERRERGRRRPDQRVGDRQREYQHAAGSDLRSAQRACQQSVHQRQLLWRAGPWTERLIHHARTSRGRRSSIATCRCSRTSSSRNRGRLQFRASFYNFLNHPLTSYNPAGGDGNLTLGFNAAREANEPQFRVRELPERQPEHPVDGEVLLLGPREEVLR